MDVVNRPELQGTTRILVVRATLEAATHKPAIASSTEISTVSALPEMGTTTFQGKKTAAPPSRVYAIHFALQLRTQKRRLNTKWIQLTIDSVAECTILQ